MKVKKPSRTALLSEFRRLSKRFPDRRISRDFFRANSKLKDLWTLHWSTFRSFADEGDAKRVEAIIRELVTEQVIGELVEEQG